MIIRANTKYHITEDIWCLFYLEDAVNYFMETLSLQRKSGGEGSSAASSSSFDTSFAAFLVHLLPQTRILLQYLHHQQQQQQQQATFLGTTSSSITGSFSFPSPTITISYHSHRVDNTAGSLASSVNPLDNGPPQPVTNSFYRTIGTIDQDFQRILSRFSNDCYFHDINLI
jgi:hypothetical protein